MTDEGFVPTPAPFTDWMVSVLFTETPSRGDKLLLPGCGTGNFAAAVRRCCSYRGHPCPDIYAVEPNGERADIFKSRFEAADEPQQPEIPEASAQQLEYVYPPDWSPSYEPTEMDITFLQNDFLLDAPREQFEYIIANPPFVQYNNIDKEKREQYAEQFETATGRFNLYAPFVEQMCNYLSTEGDLVFILPEDFLFSTNGSIRNRLREETIYYMRPLPVAVFPDHTVRTCMLHVSADTSLGLNSSFVLDTWHYTTEIAELLRGVDVSENEVEEHVADYLDRFEKLQQKVFARRQTQGREGGYSTLNDPRIETETQTDLGNWA
jgi:tRNA1(Val) A37 N6-methylase TrmN6